MRNTSHCPLGSVSQRHAHTSSRLQAFGNAAMLLASGKKGCRFALPHARIMTAPPRLNRSFGAAPNIMIKANELEYSTRTYVELLAKATGVWHLRLLPLHGWLCVSAEGPLHGFLCCPVAGR